MEMGPILRAMGRNKVRFGLIVMEVALTLAIVANCVAMIRDARGQDDPGLRLRRREPGAGGQHAVREGVPRGGLPRQRPGCGPAVAALHARRARRQQHPVPALAGRGQLDRDARGRRPGRDAAHADLQRRRADAGRPRRAVAEGRDFGPEEVERDTARLRALNNTQRETGADGRPREKFLQEVIVSRAFGQPRLRRRAAARQAPGGLGRRSLPRGGRDRRRSTTPTAGPSTSTRSSTRTTRADTSAGRAYLLRTEPGQATAVAKAVEARLLAVNGGRNLQVRTMDEIKAQYFGPQRLVSTLMTWVAVLLVLVTSLGIVGLASFSVTERTRQIGTRRALGARRRTSSRHFLLENWLLTTMGVAVGVVLAYGLNFGLVASSRGRSCVAVAGRAWCCSGRRGSWPRCAGAAGLAHLAGDGDAQRLNGGGRRRRWKWTRTTRRWTPTSSAA